MLLIQTFLALIAVVSAGTIAGCKKQCFEQAIGALGCSASDMNCICTAETFTEKLGQCVDASCTPEESEASKQVASEICSKFRKELKRFDFGGSFGSSSYGGNFDFNFGPGANSPSPKSTSATSTKVIVPTPVKSTTSVAKPAVTTPALPHLLDLPFNIPDRLLGGKVTSFPGLILPIPTGIHTVIRY